MVLLASITPVHSEMLLKSPIEHSDFILRDQYNRLVARATDQKFEEGYFIMGETRFIPTLSLQKADNQTLSGDSEQHKSMLQGRCNILIL